MIRMIIIGASSGMGYRVAADFARMGIRIGIAARREEPMRELKERYPNHVEYLTIDVCSDDAVQRFNKLIEMVGGMDYLLYASGCGWQNPELDTAFDEHTIGVNVLGFTRIINATYKYYKNRNDKRRGHIAAITSIAGTKGMGISATYSASKRYQWTYLQAIEQLARQQHVDIDITDIRPGFVDTPLLNGAKNYPLEMSVDYIAPRLEKAILKARRIAVIDARWAVVTALWSLLPNSVWTRINLSSILANFAQK